MEEKKSMFTKIKEHKVTQVAKKVLPWVGVAAIGAVGFILGSKDDTTNVELYLDGVKYDDISANETEVSESTKEEA